MPEHSTALRIGLVLFPKLTQLDLTGPAEVFSPVRYAGMALTLAGLAVTVLPVRWMETAGRGAKLRRRISS